MFVRRNLITILLSIEIMLNAVNLTFVAFGRAFGAPDGQIIVFFVMTVAAAEAAVGLAIVIGCSGTASRSTPIHSRPSNGDASRLAAALVDCMLLLIPLLPFVGFLVNASFGRRLRRPPPARSPAA